METKAEEWKGEYICSICHKQFGRPLGIAMIFYRSEHYLMNGKQCPGFLIPYEQRKPSGDVAELIRALELALTWAPADRAKEIRANILAKYGQEKKEANHDHPRDGA